MRPFISAFLIVSIVVPVGTSWANDSSADGESFPGSNDGTRPAADVVSADEQSQLDSWLDAGEFGPARSWAEAQASTSRRDAALARIARAQYSSRVARGSLATAARIEDGSLRYNTLGNIRHDFSSGARGGAVAADFDPLIELITTTIAPTSWEEVGGVGAISEFEGGVFVDPSGTLRSLSVSSTPGALLRLRHRGITAAGQRDVAQRSALRCVSLTRLERAVELAWASGRPPSEEMQSLAGLERIRYVFVHPESRDIILAGPAGDWMMDDQSRWVSVDTGRAVVRLDDLVVVLRNAFGPEQGRFSCSIDPRRENLASTQAYLDRNSKQPLAPSRAARERWLQGLRDSLGRQTVSVKGLNPQTRVARVIVEADYQMKLIGMGLADGTMQVDSYFDLLERLSANRPSLDVIRWWFTMAYDAVETLPDRTAFELHGTGAQLLSENEHLTQDGDRRHTGKSSTPTREFARLFTADFEQLQQKYAVFGELQNVFDLALVASLIAVEDVPAKVGWSMQHFLDPDRYRVTLGRASTTVETTVNHRMFDGRHIVAGASGGVHVDPHSILSNKLADSSSPSELEYQRDQTMTPTKNAEAWWWDVE